MPTNQNSNSDIWTATDAVAKALLESPEFLEVERTRRLLGEDEETREILWKYQAAKKEIHDAREQGRIVADKVLKDSKRLKKALANDSTVQAHEHAKGVFQELLRKSNLALSTALGGIDFGELALSTDD
ncbi:MAG: YlbF family regulator [Candidatus Heimdallarchaeota archaeon]